MADIILRKTNLYRSARFIQYPDGSGLVIRPLVKWKSGIGDRYHRVTQGDELPRIAFLYYSDRTKNADELWWIIADVNNIVNPFDLDSMLGQELLIPDYDKFQLAQVK